jgi:phosphoenolpyruvate phosphomutase
LKYSNLRSLFEEKDLIRIVGAHNGLTAKLVEKNGFDGIWASGLEISTSHLVPDASILSMNEFLQAAIEMNDATSIPVIADCDTGFGDLNNVIYMIKKYESNGISAVCIEDKKYPKTNSLCLTNKENIAPMEEFVCKIIAAKKTQKTKDFMVFARIESLINGLELKEAIGRSSAYVQAGADGIFVHANTTKQISNFCKEWDYDIPLIICPTLYPSFSEKKIKSLGKIKMVIYANHGIRSAIKAMNSTLSKIYNEGIVNIDNKIASLEEVFELQGMASLLNNKVEIMDQVKKQKFS